MNNTGSSRAVVIDDNSEIGRLIALAAKSAGMDCTVTTNVEEFRKALGPDVSILMIDLVMPGTDGVEILRELAAESCEACIVLISGFDNSVLRTTEQLAESLGLNVVGRLQKPFRIAEVEKLLTETCLDNKVEASSRKANAPMTREELEFALENNQIVVHYQPQIDLATERLAGVEALVRIQHPDRGLIYPDLFISICEKYGLIDALTQIVMRIGITEFERLNLPSNVTLSVNVSALSLTDLSFPDRLDALVSQNKMNPSNVVLEITESGLIRELSKALDILARLRMKGFGLSIDDFGTGYSAMAQLRRIPATELKVDRTFVKDMTSDEGARAVVDKTIALGHELGMKVVAEGAETYEQVEALKELHCDIAQGYYFSRPIPAAAFQG